MREPRSRLAAVLAAAQALAACAGGGGKSTEEELPPSPIVDYGIGGPQAALGQSPLSITPVAPAGGSTAGPGLAAVLAGDAFVYPPGPDGAGDALPAIAGSFDTLARSYDGAISSKLWLDLPAAAGGLQLAVAVTQPFPSALSLADPPTAGELLVSPRAPDPALPGKVRLVFQAAEPRVCLGWDAGGNGTWEAQECLASEGFGELWLAPQLGLSVPEGAQRAGSAAYQGFSRLMAQFDFSVGALLVAEAQRPALASAPAGAVAATVACSAVPPAGTAGSFSLAWLDRNGSGAFDEGDDVRFTADDCYDRLDDLERPGAGRLLTGVFELRGLRPGVGAAPTFVGLEVADTEEVGGEVVTRGAVVVEGGFTLRIPGLTLEGEAAQSYLFTAENMVAAGSAAARSMMFYPDVADLAYAALDRLRSASPGATALGLCAGGGTATLLFTEGQPAVAGPSPGDTATLTLAGCDLGTADEARVLDGTLALTLATVTPGPAPDWSMQADARLDLQTTTPRHGTRRSGEFGLEVGFVLGHSYYAGFHPQGYTGAPLSGVLTCQEDGALAYQLGCFDGAGTYRGNWSRASYQVRPNQVVKVKGRVFTIGIRQGETPLFIADEAGAYYLDSSIAGLIPISAPECVALGVPASGVSGGDTSMQLDAWPAGDGDHVTLRLYDKAGALVREVATSWAALVE